MQQEHRGPPALILPWPLAEGDHTGTFRSILPPCMKLTPFINPKRVGQTRVFLVKGKSTEDQEVICFCNPTIYCNHRTSACSEALLRSLVFNTFHYPPGMGDMFMSVLTVYGIINCQDRTSYSTGRFGFGTNLGLYFLSQIKDI